MIAPDEFPKCGSTRTKASPGFAISENTRAEETTESEEQNKTAKENCHLFKIQFESKKKTNKAMENMEIVMKNQSFVGELINRGMVGLEGN